MHSGAPASRRLAWRRPGAIAGGGTPPGQPAWTPAFLVALLFVIVPARAESFRIDDHSYGHPRTISISRSPASLDTSRGDYNLFLFIGEWYLEDMPAAATIDSLVATGKIGPTVAVVIDTSAEKPADITNRAKFADFMAKELMPALAKKLGRLPAANRTTVAGASFGGVTSAYLAFRHPELFGNVLSESGAFWRGNEGASQPAEWLTEQFRKSARLPVRFYIEVGDQETIVTPSGVVFIEANRHLRDVLAAKKYAVQYVEVAGGKHHPDTWRAALPAGIVFLAKAP